MWIFEGIVSQTEETASEKALRQKCALILISGQPEWGWGGVVGGGSGRGSQRCNEGLIL